MRLPYAGHASGQACASPSAAGTHMLGIARRKQRDSQWPRHERRERRAGPRGLAGSNLTRQLLLADLVGVGNEQDRLFDRACTNDSIRTVFPSRAFGPARHISTVKLSCVRTNDAPQDSSRHHALCSTQQDERSTLDERANTCNNPELRSGRRGRGSKQQWGA